jgi:hypothetical protein
VPVPIVSPALTQDDVRTLTYRLSTSTVRTSDGCLIWNGAHTGCTPDGKGGYGDIGAVAGHTVYAHRAAFYLAHGRWPVGPIHHACGRRDCVDARHLVEIGSHATHMRLHAAQRAIAHHSSALAAA